MGTRRGDLASAARSSAEREFCFGSVKAEPVVLGAMSRQTAAKDCHKTAPISCSTLSVFGNVFCEMG